MAFMVYNLVVGLYDIRSIISHFGQYISFQTVVSRRISVVEISLELRIRKFICWFILLIILRVPLDGIIREMDELIIQILEIIQLTRCSYVAFLVPVGLQQSIDTRKQHVVSDIKLAIIIQKRPIYIRLHNVGENLPVLVSVVFLDEKIDVFESRQTNASTSV